MKNLFKNKKVFILGVSLLLILVIGVTYAVVAWTTTNYNISLNTFCFDVDYELGQDISATLDPIVPEIDDTDNTITISSDMAISNVSLAFDSECTRYVGVATLEINTSALSNAFTVNGNSTGSLQYYLIPYDSSEYPNVDIEHLSGQTFGYVASGSITSTGVKDIYSTSLGPNQIEEYIIVFLIDSELIDTDVIGASFTSSVNSRVEQALETPLDNYRYSLDSSSNEVYLKKYIGTSTMVVVPSTYSVDGVIYNTVLYNDVFRGNTIIESVYLANDLMLDSMYEFFYNCTSLKSVPTIPNSVTYMQGTFQGCSSLVDAPIIPSSVDNMDRTFYGCNSLVSAPAIPNSVKTLENAFYGCSSLVNAPVIPDGVTNMAGTFYGCSSLVDTPVIPNSITKLRYTFKNCRSLVNAPIIPSSVTELYQTFYGCSSLVDAPVIPNSVTTMESAFENCTSLETAPVIPSSVTDMTLTFDGCSSLVNAPIIPSSVTKMYSTFSDCTSLVTAPVIPSSVTDMTYTFNDCPNLTGTVRINSSNVTLRYSGSSYHPFYLNNVIGKPITVEVPEGSTTYTTINSNKPARVTISTFTS